MVVVSGMAALGAGDRVEGARFVNETALMKLIMVELGRCDDLRVFRNNVGALTDVTGRVVKYGLAPGSADLLVILAPWGRAVFLEVKTDRKGSGQTGAQRNFEAVMKSLGAVYEVVRSVAEAKDVIGAVREFTLSRSASGLERVS